MKPLKRVVIKEELVELTGDYRPAIILNQFIYWIERMYDTDKYIREEKERALRHDMTVDMSESKGWIYKTAEELNNELMVGMSKATVGKYINQLVEAGYLKKRKNPKYKWDKTLQYRVDLYKVQKDLAKLGYALEGYGLLPGIEIVDKDIEDLEDVEESLEDVEESLEDVEESLEDVSEGLKNDKKKAPAGETTEASENYKDLSSSSNMNNSNYNIPQDKDNDNKGNLGNDNLDNDTLDYEQLAIERCKREIEGFESMSQFRKDVNIGIMLQRIARGE